MLSCACGVEVMVLQVVELQGYGAAARLCRRFTCEGGACGVAPAPLECAPYLFGHFQIPSFFHMFVQLLFLYTCDGVLQRDPMVGTGVAARTTMGKPKRHASRRRAGPRARTNNTERMYTSKDQSSRQRQEAPNAHRSGGINAPRSTQQP